jgi:hypothetical protein
LNFGREGKTGSTIASGILIPKMVGSLKDWLPDADELKMLCPSF